VQAGLFALLAGVVIAESLQSFSLPPVNLKWPNDVLIDGAKLAGVLIDAAPVESRLDWLVIGIGVNLRHAPEVFGRRTTSLAAHGVQLLPQEMADAISKRFSCWQDAPDEDIHAAWLARAHPIGTKLEISTGHTQISGYFAGLSARGELLLQRENRIDVISTGEVLLGQV
jgi:BirA family biotin operon repressor/biotin-[acetyl-CoA-carboxylase] ligase